MTSTIAVAELRVGMFIQLDGGWLSHPFALSSFRIASADQICTLQRLGLKQVRWWPERSDAESSADAPPNTTQQATQEATQEAAPVITLPLDPAAQQRQWRAAQQQAALHCERQHGEAAAVWRQACDAVATHPQQAGRTTQALTQAMLDKMLGDQDIAIRLVSAGGDRAAAHALNVAVISMLIGRTLGLEAPELLDLGVGALQHDVGKHGMPERHRHVDAGASAADHVAYREHVAKGVWVGKRMGLASGALLVLAQHHEHADGSGFPQALPSDRLSLPARIVALVNRYDNLCNPGTRTPALTPHEAVATLFAQGQARFDPTVLNAFIRMMGVYPAGSLVQLTDDRYGMVVGVNSGRPLKPRVLVHEGDAAELIDLERTPDVGIRRSLAPHKLPSAALAALDPRPRVAYYFEPLTHSEPVRRAQEMAA